MPSEKEKQIQSGLINDAAYFAQDLESIFISEEIKADKAKKIAILIRSQHSRILELTEKLSQYRQFSKELLELKTGALWEPDFDALVAKQEQLAIEFCNEISQLKSITPVRLLEMAESLYAAEREHHNK